MVLPAAEWTTQIGSVGAARVGKKPNPAVNTVSYALLQFGIRLQYRVQRDLILLDKRTDAIVLVPVLAKRENLLDRDDIKARLSVIMRIVFFTPSSYLIDANASRGRARFFCTITKIRGPSIRANDPRRIAYSSSPSYIACASPLQAATWNKEETNFIFFPSSGSLELSKRGSN